MKKISIVGLVIFFIIIYSCQNVLKSDNDDDAKADINISWSPGSDYVYYSVYNTGEIPITSFYIDIKVKYSGGVSEGRRFGSKDCDIQPGKSYSGSKNISKSGKTIISVVQTGYGLNTTNWMYD